MDSSTEYSPDRMRSFDPRLVGARECRAWEMYYRRRWAEFLFASVGWPPGCALRRWWSRIMGRIRVRPRRPPPGPRAGASDPLIRRPAGGGSSIARPARCSALLGLAARDHGVGIGRQRIETGAVSGAGAAGDLTVRRSVAGGEDVVS